MDATFLGITLQMWMIVGGVAMLGGSALIVDRYGLQRRGITAPLADGRNRLPALAALALGLAGGALFFLGMRGG
ncbi:MAG TPA: hypothetical protein VG757_02495 [Devosia sp.]|nr:hypothetical protein [Devosia sp.]